MYLQCACYTTNYGQFFFWDCSAHSFIIFRFLYDSDSYSFLNKGFDSWSGSQYFTGSDSSPLSDMLWFWRKWSGLNCVVYNILRKTFNRTPFNSVVFKMIVNSSIIKFKCKLSIDKFPEAFSDILILKPVIIIL